MIRAPVNWSIFTTRLCANKCFCFFLCFNAPLRFFQVEIIPANGSFLDPWIWYTNRANVMAIEAGKYFFGLYHVFKTDWTFKIFLPSRKLWDRTLSLMLENIRQICLINFNTSQMCVTLFQLIGTLVAFKMFCKADITFKVNMGVRFSWNQMFFISKLFIYHFGTIMFVILNCKVDSGFHQCLARQRSVKERTIFLCGPL